MASAFDRVFHPIYPYRYQLFMVACLLLILNTAVPRAWAYQGLFNGVIVSFHVFAGAMLWYKAKSSLAVFFFYFGLSVIALRFLESFQIISFGGLLPAVSIVFFLAVSAKIYRDIYQAKEIDVNIVLAVFTGLILLGLISTFLFVIVELLDPDSFRGMDPTLSSFDNLMYFSFISLLTIGYGDLVPATSVTRTLSILVGLIGNFYTIIVTGIIVGKFLASGQSPDQS